jgi:lipid-A-disaccharide synthase
MEGASAAISALTAALAPIALAAGVALGLRVVDPRRFPRNALWMALALASALGLRAALAAATGLEASRSAAQAAALATALAYAFRRRAGGAARSASWIAAAALAAAGLLLSQGSTAERAGGAVLGAAAALALLRGLELVHALGAPSPLPPPRKRRPGEPLRVHFVAGEASGDLYAARVLAALRAHLPGVVAEGLGGDRLRAAGLRSLGDASALSIVGFTGVLAALPRLARLYRGFARALDREPPHVLVCVDLPDWNGLLALQARARAVATLFFVAPQVWAWRPGRVAALADRISRLVVLFPFEAPAWAAAGVPVVCHGHPLVEVLAERRCSRAEAAARLGLDPRRPTLALAPGSRASELAHHVGPLLGAAARLQRELPSWQLAVALAPLVPEDPLRAAAARLGLEIRCVRDAAFELFLAAEFGLVCSGTATLEAALAELPMLVFYRGSALNMAIARRLVRVDRIALPNLLLGGPAPVFPELLQEAVTPAELARVTLECVRDPARMAALRAAGARVRERAPAGATADAVAREIATLADGVAREP